jgi:hypothetical protein
MASPILGAIRRGERSTVSSRVTRGYDGAVHGCLGIGRDRLYETNTLGVTGPEATVPLGSLSSPSWGLILPS